MMKYTDINTLEANLKTYLDELYPERVIRTNRRNDVVDQALEKLKKREKDLEKNLTRNMSEQREKKKSLISLKP